MLNIPTTKEIYEALLADIQSALGGTIPIWRKAFVRALAMAMAAKYKVAYLSAAFVQRNIFPDLADSEEVGGTLERFGRAKLGRGPLAPTQGKYNITVSGNVGAVLDVNTTWKSDDTSSNADVMYVLDTTHTMTAITNVVMVRCMQAGLGGRQSVGDALLLTAPVVGVDNTAYVASEEVSPFAGETIEEYRRVVLQSYRLMPQGGAPADYRLWAQDADGVYDSYPYNKQASPGAVILFVEATKSDSVDGRGTPTATTLTAVDGVVRIDPVTGRGRLPLGVVALEVAPVTIIEVRIDISGMSSMPLLDKQRIDMALAELVDSVRPFVAGADIIAYKQDVLSVNMIISKILETLPGSAFAAPVLTVTLPSSISHVVTEYVFDYGSIPYLTGVNYV